MSDLKADVEALKILRAEDARRHDLAIEELETKVETAEAQVRQLTGAVNGLAGKQAKPWYKQPPFWAGVLTLPSLLLAGKLFAVFDQPEIISMMHRLLGTTDAMVVALQKNDSPFARSVDKRVVAQGAPGKPLVSELENTFAKSSEIEGLVHAVVLREIEKSFRTVHISSLRLGLAGYEPELFAGAEAIQMDPVKVEDRLFSVPPEKKVDIIIGVHAQRFDTAHIAVNSAPHLRRQLPPEEIDRRLNRIRIVHEYQMEDLPEIEVNKQALALEPLTIGNLPVVGDDGKLRSEATYIFKVSGVDTGQINETLSTTTMSLTAKTREGDLDTAWYLNVFVNLATDDGA